MILFLLLGVASAWTVPLLSAQRTQRAPSTTRPQPVYDFASGSPTQAFGAVPALAPALSAQARTQAPPVSAPSGAALALCAVALAGYGVRRAALAVGGGYPPRYEYDTYRQGRFDYDTDSYREGTGRYDYGPYGRYGRENDRVSRYEDRYDRYGRRYGPRGYGTTYGAVNREGYGAIGAMPGSWARNAQVRDQYRRHERYGHPAYEASRVRRMGIGMPHGNSAVGYQATIRDAQYRRWTRDRDYEMYMDEVEDEHEYERERMRDREYYDDDRVYGRVRPYEREYDRELVD